MYTATLQDKCASILLARSWFLRRNYIKFSGFQANCKEHKTEAYTLCAFRSNQNATQDNIDFISGISLDFDEGLFSYEIIKEMLVGLDIEFLIHTTAKHTFATPRLRVVIPYFAPLRGEDGKQLHKATWAYFNDLLGPIDPAGKNPTQKWLFPKYGLEGELFLWKHVEGECRFNPLEEFELTPTQSIRPARSPFSRVTTEQSEFGELESLLSGIDPLCTYQEWFEVIAASINAFGRTGDVIDYLDGWSQGSPDQYSPEAFHKAVESVRDDHEHPAGIGKLRYLAGVSTRHDGSEREKVTTSDLEAIVEPKYYEQATRLAASSYSNALELLRRYNNDPDENHSTGIWSICEGMAYSAFAHKPIRVAYALETGLGKTTSFRGFVKSLWESGQELAVAYCAERIEDLNDLKLNLIKDGIPECKIGLFHRSPRYQDIPSIERHEAGEYRILLLAHGRVQHEFTDPSSYLYYQKEKRDLVVWDEALLTTKGEAINIDTVRGDIASWKT